MPSVRVPRGKVWIQMDDDPQTFKTAPDVTIHRAEHWKPYAPTATVLSVGPPIPVVKRINGKRRQVLDHCDLKKGARILVPSTCRGTTLRGGGDEVRILTFEEVRNCIEVEEIQDG